MLIDIYSDINTNLKKLLLNWHHETKNVHESRQFQTLAAAKLH